MAQSDENHKLEMKAKQEAMRAKMKAAKGKRGLLLVHTGEGKGKSTAAFGMLTRSLAHGHGCGVIQFIKSSPDAVEKVLRCDHLKWKVFGDGFTWDTQDKASDIARCREGWTQALAWMRDPSIRFILLDELNVILSYDYLPVEEVLEGLAGRLEHQHVVMTGRGAPPELVEVADLVTEMKDIKHPFRAGIQAQAGLEF